MTDYTEELGEALLEKCASLRERLEVLWAQSGLPPYVPSPPTLQKSALPKTVQKRAPQRKDWYGQYVRKMSAEAAAQDLAAIDEGGQLLVHKDDMPEVLALARRLAEKRDAR